MSTARNQLAEAFAQRLCAMSLKAQAKGPTVYVLGVFVHAPDATMAAGYASSKWHTHLGFGAIWCDDPMDALQQQLAQDKTTSAERVVAHHAGTAIVETAAITAAERLDQFMAAIAAREPRP